MILFKTVHELTQYIEISKKKQQTIGYVPTMGALHQGHLSLISSSKQTCTITICSIFVNPTQFNDSNDFEKYPITIEQDIFLLETIGCDVLFLPNVSEIYPQGITQLPNYNLGYLETILEGYFRPQHFQGVCQVMHRLLSIIKPNTLFLGQKDYQQCMVIAKMIHNNKWEQDIQIVISPTLREPSGLAMSSRNARLSDIEKENASAVYNALLFIQKHIRNIPFQTLIQEATTLLLNAGFTHVDYVAICKASTLEPITQYNVDEPLVALIAAFMGEVRLIDNITIK